MPSTFIFIVVIAGGVIIAIQGARLLKGKQKPTIWQPERVLISVFGIRNAEDQLRVLGRIRIIVGMFLVAIGIWALF